MSIIQLIDNEGAVNPRLQRLIAALPMVGRGLLLAGKLVVLAELLAFWFVVALGGFVVSIMPEAAFRRSAHGGAVNLHAVTVARGVCVVLVVLAVFGGVWCCRRIAVLLHPFRQWLNLLAAVAFAIVAVALFLLVVTDLEFFRSEMPDILISVATGILIAACWLWSAVRKLRRPVAA